MFRSATGQEAACRGYAGGEGRGAAEQEEVSEKQENQGERVHEYMCVMCVCVGRAWRWFICDRKIMQ